MHAKENADLNRDVVQFGPIQFTRAGAELYWVVDAPMYDDFVAYCVKKWQGEGWRVVVSPALASSDGTLA